MSHSKRNTSRAVFTSHERALAKSNWTSSSARLTRDSFLPFASCSLCLVLAVDPVSCPHGDVFCRECALANILAQKKDLKRSDKARRVAERDAVRKGEERFEEERERAVRDFEMTQAGLDYVPGRETKAVLGKDGIGGSGEEEKSREVVVAVDGINGGIKRKFEDDVEQSTRADHIKARKAIDDEKASKTALSSFWTPSLTPDVLDSKHGAPIKKVKATPTCPASPIDHPHSLSMQKLITINFDQQVNSSTKEAQRFCPSCRKPLSNSSGGIMAKRCGHVLCQSCVKQFLLPSSKKPVVEEEPVIACFTCDEPVAVLSAKTGQQQDASKDSLPSGLVKLKSEGTGFSARGTSTVEKSSVAFQC